MYGIIAILGNLLVILAKSLGEPENETWKVHKFLIANVCASKILMGVFLCVLVRGDMMYGNDYLYYQFKWQSGIKCRFAGVSALVSCESFVFLYGLLSYVHWKRLTEPVSFYKVSLATLTVWCVAVVLGLFGLLGHRESDFYEMTNHCVALPLVRRPSNIINEVNDNVISSRFYNRSMSMKIAHGTQSAWGYSILLWFVINLPIIVAGTVLHFKSYLITRQLEAVKQDGEIIVDDMEDEVEDLENPEVEIRVTGTGPRLGFVVTVDCLTWFGLIVLFFVTQIGVIEITVHMYTIIAVVVLGFGSFLCPVVFMFAFLCTGEYEEDPPGWYAERLQEMLREEEEERLRLEEEERIQKEAEEKLRLEEEQKAKELSELDQEGEINDGFEGVEVIEKACNKSDGDDSAGDSGVAEACAGSASGSHHSREDSGAQSQSN